MPSFLHHPLVILPSLPPETTFSASMTSPLIVSWNGLSSTHPGSITPTALHSESVYSAAVLSGSVSFHSESRICVPCSASVSCLSVMVSFSAFYLLTVSVLSTSVPILSLLFSLSIFFLSFTFLLAVLSQSPSHSVARMRLESSSMNATHCSL